MEVDTRLNMLSIAESDGTVMTGAASSRSAMGHTRYPIQWTQGAVCCQKSGRSVKLITCPHPMTIIRMCVPYIQ
jgi:porphobilinogen deaminase